MTPQRKGFNRESWAEIETILRTIVDNTPQNYFVITGPILTDSLDTIDKSINRIRIPDLHFKIIADLTSSTPKV